MCYTGGKVILNPHAASAKQRDTSVRSFYILRDSTGRYKTPAGLRFDMYFDDMLKSHTEKGHDHSADNLF